MSDDRANDLPTEMRRSLSKRAVETGENFTCSTVSPDGCRPTDQLTYPFRGPRIDKLGVSLRRYEAGHPSPNDA